MKFGMRTPSIKKRIKARTTGKAKRKLKKAVNPVYGKKGVGWVNNPKKATYNKVYNKTTFDVTKSKRTKSKKATARNTATICKKQIDKHSIYDDSPSFSRVSNKESVGYKRQTTAWGITAMITLALSILSLMLEELDAVIFFTAICIFATLKTRGYVKKEEEYLEK